ncbi:MAG TPA: serine hydrolase [Candidatus Kapabacteria bacterium]|nr:serine hydrolase [Candidatus Kapabacteria bacterium]
MKKIYILSFSILLCFNALAQEQNAIDPIIAMARKVMDYKQSEISGLFSDGFLKEVPHERLVGILKQFNDEYGAFISVRKTSKDKLEYHYEKALIPGTLHLDRKGKIDGLWFGSPQMLNDTYGLVLGELKKLGETVAVTIRKNGKETIVAYNNTVPLAIGSAFKMAILEALVDKIHRGEATWGTVIPLQKNMMAFPSGSLQTWQPGTPMTLASLANLMISRSDNTAADHLLFYCGRENVEKYVPDRDRPYPSTLELVKLKYGMNVTDSVLHGKYLAAKSIAEKREVLAEVDSAAKDNIEPTTEPKDISSLEWFYTTDELCDIIERVRDQPAMQINPAVADTGEWRSVAYKGGSEPGVINMTYALDSKNTKNSYTISVTANNSAEDIDEDAFASIVERLIELVRANDK